MELALFLNNVMGVIKGDYMEHRWSKRFNVNVDVLLYHRGGRPIKCKTYNAGTAGIFIKSVLETLTKNSFLEVEFEEGANLRYKKNRSHRIRALVIHSSKQGVGLMFLKPEPETLLAWRQVMRRAHHQLSSSSLPITTSSFYPDLITDYMPASKLISKSQK